MSESTTGCGCGCGGHDAQETDERAAAPVVVQPLGEGYTEPEPVAAPASESLEAAGVVPGHKAGNILGLRDVSATAGGGCGCGGHGHGHGHGHAHGHGHGAGGCGCGQH